MRFLSSSIALLWLRSMVLAVWDEQVRAVQGQLLHLNECITSQRSGEACAINHDRGIA